MIFKCQRCRMKIDIPEIIPGKKVKCPECGFKQFPPADMMSTSSDTRSAPPRRKKGRGAKRGRASAASSAGTDTRRSSRDPRRESTHEKRCPKCNYLIPARTVICPNCYFNIQSGKSMMKADFKTRISPADALKWTGVLILIIFAVYFVTKYRKQIHEKYTRAKTAANEKLNELQESRQERMLRSAQLAREEEMSRKQRDYFMRMMFARLRDAKPTGGIPLKLLNADGSVNKEQVSRRDMRLDTLFSYSQNLIAVLRWLAPDGVLDETTGADGKTLSADVLQTKPALAEDEIINLVAIKMTWLFRDGNYIVKSDNYSWLLFRLKHLTPVIVEEWRKKINIAMGTTYNKITIALMVGSIDVIFNKGKYQPVDAAIILERLPNIDKKSIEKFMKTYESYRGAELETAIAIARENYFFDDKKFDKKKFDTILAYKLPEKAK